jgi:hypothetical protein
LVTGCACVRLALADLPNFAPVAAVALFAGYYFRSAVLALCVPFCAMAFSDVFIGGYDWRMMLTVYAMLMLPVAMRGPLRRHLAIRGDGQGSWKPVAGLLSCSLAASLLFFLVTNFGCWIWFDLYEHSLAGLVNCYVQALPFFRYTLAGDALFAVVLFGGYGLAAHWAPATSSLSTARQ